MGYGASLDLPWVKSPEASGNTGDYPTSKNSENSECPNEKAENTFPEKSEANHIVQVK